MTNLRSPAEEAARINALEFPGPVTPEADRDATFPASSDLLFSGVSAWRGPDRRASRPREVRDLIQTLRRIL
jgi:hypothetical protein